MKKIFFLLAICFTLFTSCSAQLVKTVNDITLITKNEEFFLNKPLSLLLNEIKPQVQLFMTEQGYGNKLSTISLYFVDYRKFSEVLKNKKKPARIVVSLVGRITENDYSLPLAKRFVWTKYYQKKNQDLIVKQILVSEGVE